MRGVVVPVLFGALAVAGCSSSGNDATSTAVTEVQQSVDPASTSTVTEIPTSIAEALPATSPPARTVLVATTTTPPTTVPLKTVPVPDALGPGGTVTIDGEVWTFDAETCETDGGLRAGGLGANTSGVPAWIVVSVDNSVDFDGDGELDASATVAVEVGRLDLATSPLPDQPDWYATTTQAGDFVYRQFEFTFDGVRLSGAGTIEDYNAIDLPYGEAAELSFDVGCR